jgi:hypothetical protein
MEQTENSKTGPLSGGNLRPTEPVVRTGRNEVKPPISPSSDLGVSSGSAEEDGQGKESKG